MPTTVSQADRIAAENLLEEFVSELLPDADFSPGSITRDHTITAIGAVFAFLRKEARKAGQAQSLVTALQLEDPTDRLNAVERLVSNWLLTSRDGTYARGVATLHFSSPHDGLIPTTVRFLRKPNLSFRIDSVDATSYKASDLVARRNRSGDIVSWTLRVSLIAEGAGPAYSIGSGAFDAVTPFNRLLLLAEVEDAFAAALDVESPEELAERLPNAVSTRDLNSTRSIWSVLRDSFPFLTQIVTIGMRDPEMRRDVLELLAPENILHLGGAADIYLQSATTTKIYEAPVGGISEDPRLGITIFRDNTVADWRALNITPGCVLYHRNYATYEPSLYIIREVEQAYLRVSSQQAFPSQRPTLLRDGDTLIDGVFTAAGSLLSSPSALFTAEDVGRFAHVTGSVSGNDGHWEITDVTAGVATVAGFPADETDVQFTIEEDVVYYSIGAFGPNYDNLVAVTSTGEFTRSIQQSGHLLLPPEPIYLIREVTILDLSAAGTPFNPLEGSGVELLQRVNTVPDPAAGDTALEYRVRTLNPTEANSSRQLSLLEVGTGVEQYGAYGVLEPDGLFYQLSDASALFVAADIGKRIYILDAVNPENRGELVITAINDPNTVRVDSAYISGWAAVTETQLSWEMHNTHKYDGLVCRVTYDTMDGFSQVDEFIQNTDYRLVVADLLAKGFYAVYLSFEIQYRLLPNAVVSEEAQGDVGEDDVSQAVADFINAFPANQVIHASDIVSGLHAAIPRIDSVKIPIDITYTLYAPDGRAIPYLTQDAVRLNAGSLASPDPDYRLEDPLTLGVSDQNVRYLSDATLIQAVDITEG